MRKAALFPMRSAFLQFALIFFCIGFSSFSAYSQDDEDCPPLTVFCQDLHTTFMPDACMVEVWAKDFISKINDPDTDLDDFVISFEKDSVVMSRIFESTGGSSYEVVIWVSDTTCTPANQTSCIVRLDINDNTGECPTTPCPIEVQPWCGYAVVTCTTVRFTPNENIGHVAAVIDTRKNSSAPRGDDWAQPNDGGATPVPIFRPDAWRINNIGNLFGVALNPATGWLYLAASDVYEFDWHQFQVGPHHQLLLDPVDLLRFIVLVSVCQNQIQNHV